MKFFQILTIIIVSFYLITVFRYLLRLSTFIREYKKVKKLSNQNLEKKLLFVIPMYKEKKLAKETFDFFANISKLSSKIYIAFVCTAKEDAIGEEITTYDILEACRILENNQNIKIYKYPETTGIMAHQVNYAVKSFYEESQDKDFWVAIYNCDSRIYENSLNEIFYNVNKADNKTVFQQYSYYHIPGKGGTSITMSGAVWQTRWSIFKENAMARNRCRMRSRHKKFNAFWALFEPFSYCIGHGIVINAETFIGIGGMPEDSINEDTFMGYVICSEGMLIKPLYSLEKAESVGKVKTLISQQTSWYNGPVQSMKYYKSYCEDNNCTFKRPICKEENRLQAKIRALRSFDYAICWLASPVILLILLPIFACLGFGWVGVLIALATAEVFLYLVNLLMFFALKDQGIKIMIPSPIFDLVFYFCHSLSTFIWIFKNIQGKNRIDNKYKTER